MPEIDQSAEVAAALAERGWSVSKDFLPPPLIAALATEARALWADGAFKAAGIGRGASFKLRPEIRSDQVLWLNDDRLTAAQTQYRAAMEKLRAALNEALFAGLREFEFHLAVFPPGAFYRWHVDRFGDADQRAISTTLYLNVDWRATDGGALRLHLPDGCTDVLPQAGMLVVFRSDTIPHEVLPATRARFSLTGWFKRRAIDGHVAAQL